MGAPYGNKDDGLKANEMWYLDSIIDNCNVNSNILQVKYILWPKVTIFIFL
jgi:hypothetical protein